jgi:hypothetical protein
MLGLVEWIMHDVSYSEDAVGPHTPGEVSFEGPPAPAEYIDVPIPAGDEAFDPDGHGNRTFRVWRTKPAAGTGTSKANPREHENGATAWLDGGSMCTGCSAWRLNCPRLCAVRVHRGSRTDAALSAGRQAQG